MKTDREVMQQALDALSELENLLPKLTEAIALDGIISARRELRARLVNPEPTVQGE